MSQRRCGVRSGPHWFAAALIAGSMFALGCATLVPRLDPPQIEISAVQFAGGNLQQQQIRLTLHATNPNNREIAVRAIECDLELEGTAFAHGETDAAFTLPALGSADVDINVTANVGNALLLLAAGHLGNRSVDYHFFGKVHLAAGVVRTIPFNGTGRVRL